MIPHALSHIAHRPAPLSRAALLCATLTLFGCGGGGGQGSPSPGTGGAPAGGSGGARSSGGTTGQPTGSGGTGGIPAGTGGTTGAGGTAVDAGGSGGAMGTDALDAPAPMPEVAADVPAAGGKLRIFFIDAEGGAATLLIAPTGESLLADTGWGGSRDVNRIAAVLEKERGMKKLDYFIATHYHVDHVGGAGSLARAVTVQNFIDHGPSVEGGGDFNTYRGAVTAAMAESRRMSVTPGMKVMLGEVEITILTAAGKVANLPTAIANPSCAGANPRNDAQDEDPQSVGFVARHGKFSFVDLGDLTAGVEHRLACPMNQVGQVDIFQASQHGSAESNAPTLLQGLAPQVVVFNNGAGKGGDASIFTRVKALPSLKDLWSLHRKGGNGPAENAEEALTANTDGPDMGHHVRAEASADGSFTVTNGRTGMTRSYPAR